MEVQNPVAILLHGTQGKSQNAIHEIKRISLDVERSVGWIGIKQIVGDPPRAGIAMIVDEQSESSHIGDVNKCVVTFVTGDMGLADVDRDRYEQGIILELIFRKLILAENLVRL